MMTDDKQASMPGLQGTLLLSEGHEASFLGHPSWPAQVLKEIWEVGRGMGRAHPEGGESLSPSRERASVFLPH